MKKGKDKHTAAYRKYFYWLAANMKSQFAYRGVIIENIFDFLLRIILMLLLWKSIYGQSVSISNRTFEQMKLYILVSTTIAAFYAYPSIYFLSMDIKHGEVAYSLIRPIDFQLQFIFKNLGIIMTMAVTILPCFFICIFLLHVTVAFESFFFAVIGTFIGILTCVLFDFTLGTLCFWTENSWGITFIRQFAIQFLSGAFIPLDFFPGFVKKVLINWLPFSGIIYIPVQFLVNPPALGYFMLRVSIQLGWCIMLLWLGRLLYRRMRSQIMINGG